MRNLPLPSRDSARDDLVKSIRARRYRREDRGHAITPEELNAILALYDRYDRDHAKPCDALKGGAFPKTLTDALYRAYDSTQEGRRLYSVRRLLFSDVDLCPICGIDPVAELDHYLPRSVFKPLAIYTRNLVPMCHACNHAKLAGFGAQGDGETRFLHAYFDKLPDVDFLRAEVAIRDGGLVVEFSIAEDAALPGDYAERIAHQMTALNLNARYEAEVNTYISSHAVALHLQYGIDGAKGVRAFLKLQSRFEMQAFYRNHWRPTLLGALASHDQFTDGGFAAVLPMPKDILDDIASLD